MATWSPFLFGGEGGNSNLDTGLSPYNALAGAPSASVTSPVNLGYLICTSHVAAIVTERRCAAPAFLMAPEAHMTLGQPPG